MYKSLPLLPLHRSLRHNLNRLWRGRRHRYSTDRSDELSADYHTAAAAAVGSTASSA